MLQFLRNHNYDTKMKTVALLLLGFFSFWIFGFGSANNPTLEGFECTGGSKWRIAKFGQIYCYGVIKVAANVRVRIGSLENTPGTAQGFKVLCTGRRAFTPPHRAPNGAVQVEQHLCVGICTGIYQRRRFGFGSARF